MLPTLLPDRSDGPDPGREAGALPDARPGRLNLTTRVLHPFLFATFPILFLYSYNVYETEPGSVAGPLALSLAGATVLWLALRAWSRDGRRAGLATSLLVGLFFAFGKITLGLEQGIEELSTLWVPTSYRVPGWLLAGLLAAAAAPLLHRIFVRLRDPGRWTAFLNMFGIVLVAMPTAQALAARMREPARPIIRGASAAATAAQPPRLPDIYYIILDGYARTDVMRELFGFDNRPFLEHLERKGFHVAPRSTSNYSETKLSLCSSLNCDYLDRLIDPRARADEPLTTLIGENLVINSLRPHGYRFVTFATGYGPTDHPEADVYLHPHHPGDSFHRLVLAMTPLRTALPGLETWDVFSFDREQTLYILDHLPDVTRIEGPTFTLAHLICPHPPFVLGEHGEDVSPRPGTAYARYADLNDEGIYRDGYRKQAAYLTGRVEQLIDRLLAESPEPPIIILQSDHGSGMRYHPGRTVRTDVHERMSILNCYYFPDADYARIADDITPVNSFRVVLDQFFGATLPLLEGRNYLTSDPTTSSVIDVTELVRARNDAGPDPGRGTGREGPPSGSRVNRATSWPPPSG